MDSHPFRSRPPSPQDSGKGALDWDLCWVDSSVGTERIVKLKTHQRINHFSGMLEICRKNRMARNLERMRRVCPEAYTFAPRTYVLPEDADAFLTHLQKARARKGSPRATWILKPDAGCQGRGIQLVQTIDQAREALDQYAAAQMSNVVAQRYLREPFLINQYKFDMRVYVLVLSVDPLRMFLYHEGLARFCTAPYQSPTNENLDCAYMHLTNSAVNRRNSSYHAAGTASSASAQSGAKWSLAALSNYLESLGHNWGKLMDDIGDIAVKMVLSIAPMLRDSYRNAVSAEHDGFVCFEVLGLDIMLDKNLRVVLLENNHMPSFATDSELDLEVKEGLITDTLKLVNMDPKRISQLKSRTVRDP